MDDFASVAVAPPVVSVRDERRLIEFVVRMNKAIPAVEAVEAVEEDAQEGIEAVAAVSAVAAVPAGIKMEEIEFRYANFSSTNEKTDDNPDGVVSQNGANLYKNANMIALRDALFKTEIKAEIEARLAEDNIN